MSLTLIHSLKRARKLVDVALPKGFEGSAKLPKTQTTLENCWWAVDRIINRPGIRLLANTTKVARGQFVFNGEHYQVVSTDLIKITNHETGAFTVVGTIAGFEPIESATGFVHQVIIVKGGNGYTFDGTTLTQITDPQFLPSNSVDHINGRFVYIPSDGSPAFFSDIGDGSSIQPANFFDAEELPDKNEVVINFNNTLYIGGTDSFELFRNTGTDSQSFSRLQNGRVQTGYIGGILEYNQRFIFIGREKDQDLGIYAIAQGQSPKISNEAVDTILKTYTIDQLRKVVSARFKWNGYDIATFTLPNHAFGFLGGYWFLLTTRLDDDSAPWQAGYIQHFKGKYYTAYNDKIGVLDDVQTDYGNSFRRGVKLGFSSEGNKGLTLKGLTFDISQGFNSDIGSVALQLSRDNVTYGPVFYRDTGRIGDYARKLEWTYPGGLGYYYGFVGVYLWTTENIDFSATKLVLDI